MRSSGALRVMSGLVGSAVVVPADVAEPVKPPIKFEVRPGERVGSYNVKAGTWTLAEIAKQIPGAVADGEDVIVVRDPRTNRVRAYKIARRT